MLLMNTGNNNYNDNNTNSNGKYVINDECYVMLCRVCTIQADFNTMKWRYDEGKYSKSHNK
jgi:hypothetical protein